MKFLLVVLALAGLAAAKPKNLQDDLHEIAALIPIEEIKGIVLKYADNGDTEVVRIIKYLQSTTWQDLVAAVAGMPEYQELKDYLKDAGLDIDGLIKKIHDFINSIDVSKTTKKSPRSLRDMVDEIKEKVDLNVLLQKINELLTDSEDFQAFMEKISSEKTHQLVESVRQLPEVQRLADTLKGMGIDITAVLDAIYAFLGWN